MNAPVITFSDDQAEAWDQVAVALRQSGIDLDDSLLQPPLSDKTSVMAVIGKAGSGKTMLLAKLYEALEEAGVDVISGDWEGRKRKDRRTLAILAPTNKAASVETRIVGSIHIVKFLLIRASTTLRPRQRKTSHKRKGFNNKNSEMMMAVAKKTLDARRPAP